MNMDFGANKTPVEVIKEGAFGGTYLVDIYSVLVLMVNGTTELHSESHEKNLIKLLWC